MWDYYEPPRPRFYRRPWFLATLAVLMLAVIAGFVYFLSVKAEFEKKAAQFDLKKLEEMESASTIFDRSGAVIGRIFFENRDTVPLRDLPYELVQALVAAEDARFFQHHGVDYYGMLRAATKNWRARGIRQGASTITQQLARNTFGLRERTYDRKMIEIFLARRIESHYGTDAKTKVLELYLNRVYFGSGFFGIEAAARGYFGKPARDLTLSECATLCGLLKNPNGLSPWSNRQACVDSRNFVLGRMLELKIIKPEQYKQAVAQNISVKNRRQFHTDSYALDMVRQQVDDLLGRGEATSGGYKIYTTLDGELQKLAEARMERQLREVESRDGYEHPRYESFDAQFKAQRKKGGEPEGTPPVPDYLQGAIVAIDNATGGILALTGGRDFAHSQYNRATQSLRPAGTAFTPFVFAAGLERGMFLGMPLQDAVIDNRQVMIGGVTGILGEWGPERADNRYEGVIPARTALVKSKNAATVRFGMQVGVDNVIALAKSAGLSRVVGKDKSTGQDVLNLRPYPATFLGSSEVTLMDMVLAYSIIPNGGRRPEKPFLITRIEEKDGAVFFQAKNSLRPVIKESTAYEIHSCLSESLEWGTADKAYSKYGLKKFPVGGKTGTAYNFTDVWFVGYSSAVTCGVWLGFDAPKPIYRGAFSNEVALPVWVDVMNATFTRYPAKEIVPPAGLKKYEVCRNSGLAATPQCVEDVQDKVTGETVQQRTTFFEIATTDQAPKIFCTVHGDAPQILAGAPPPVQPGRQQWPRPLSAVDAADVQAVALKAPTVLGDDPYALVKTAVPVADAQTGGPVVPPVKKPDKSKSPEDIEVRRAQPVRPIDAGTAQDSPIKLDPPPAIQF